MYVKHEGKIIDMMRPDTEPLLVNDDIVFDASHRMLLKKVTYPEDDREYYRKCREQLVPSEIFILPREGSFTVSMDVKNGLVDTLEYDRIFLNGRGEDKGYSSRFLVASDDENHPVGSVNIFTSNDYPGFMGFLGIKKSPVGILGNYHGVAEALLEAACQMVDGGTLVIPAPLESIQKLLLKKGFAHVEGDYTSRIASFNEPICSLRWYFYKLCGNDSP